MGEECRVRLECIFDGVAWLGKECFFSGCASVTEKVFSVCNGEVIGINNSVVVVCIARNNSRIFFLCGDVLSLLVVR